MPFRKSIIYFLPEDLKNSETVHPPIVPFADFGQEVLAANQNFSCFNLSPFPCVCYSLALTVADLGARRQTEAQNGSEPGFSLVPWDVVSSDSALRVWGRPGSREDGMPGLGEPGRRSGERRSFWLMS